MKLLKLFVLKLSFTNGLLYQDCILNDLKTHQNHNLARDQKFGRKIERNKNAFAK